MTTEEMKFFEDLFRSLESEMNQKFGEVRQDIADVRATVNRMEARLDKIAAGAHYVSRLVEWSESQDKFQMETHQRLSEMDARLRKIEGQGR